MGFELLFIGLILAAVFIAVTGYYPGGIIVPGYLVLFIEQPFRLAGTLTASIFTLLCYKLASRYLILFGKRRFVFMILLGAIFSLIISYLVPGSFPGQIDYRVIGWVIPGLIANNFERQGIVVTASSLAIVVTATWFAGRIYFYII